MIIESFSPNEEPPKSTVLSLQNTLLLCVADSIDALATGFSLSMQSVRIGIVWAALIIGFLAFLISGLGIQLGRYFSSKLGAKVTLVGGIILIVIGARILIEHTM
jgi:putative Mn2+ efflux pump MntP